VKFSFNQVEESLGGRFSMWLDGVEVLKHPIETEYESLRAQFETAMRHLARFRTAQIMLSPDNELCFFHQTNGEIEIIQAQLRHAPNEYPAVLDSRRERARSNSSRTPRWSIPISEFYSAVAQAFRVPLPSKFEDVIPEDLFEFAHRCGALELQFKDDGRLSLFSKGAPPLAGLMSRGKVLRSGVIVSDVPILFLLMETRSAQSSHESIEMTRQFCLALLSKRLKLASNPLIELLVERSNVTMSKHLEPHTVQAARARIRTPQTGAVRGPSKPERSTRTLFETMWESPVIAQAHACQVSKRGVTVAGSTQKEWLGLKGDRRDLVAGDEVLLSDSGHSLIRRKEMVTLHEPNSLARWCRNDMGTLGYLAWIDDNRIITVGTHLSVRSLSTGAEVWRVNLHSRRPAHIVRQKSFVFIATQEGALWGLQLQKHQIAFCLEGTMPCVALEPWGRKGVACTFTSANRTTARAIHFEQSSASSVSFECTLKHPTKLICVDGIFLIAGQRGQSAFLLGFNASGNQTFEKKLPCTALGLSLFATNDGALVVDGIGTCVALNTLGEIAFRAGSHGHIQMLKPFLHGDLLVLPGVVTRFLQRKTGHCMGIVRLRSEPLAFVPGPRNTWFVLEKERLTKLRMNTLKVLQASPFQTSDVDGGNEAVSR
jgi:hypothetical protein